MVAGFVNVVADSIADPVKVDICRIDFLAGTATRNDAPTAAPGRAIPVSDWTNQTVPAACRF